MVTTTDLASPPFGAQLKGHRLAAGLTQERLAERAGISARAVSDLERDAGRRPRVDTVALLADALVLAPAPRATLIAAARPDSALSAGTGRLSTVPGQVSSLPPPDAPRHNLPHPLRAPARLSPSAWPTRP
jgi:transcriptional regulator with XRE-family HTH domain